mmetsp:Transcript_22540/g.37888  ORF Transcript_22540/g.37888 Transcript_22540/m.37888 type:complete len:90 (+) Transcript_22540:56-325(+)
MNTVRVVRNVVRVQTRRNSNLREIFEKKDHIAARRAKCYSDPAVGADNPTYLKEGTDKLVTGAAITGLGFGFLCILSGLYSMSYGINKK